VVPACQNNGNELPYYKPASPILNCLSILPVFFASPSGCLLFLSYGSARLARSVWAFSTIQIAKTYRRGMKPKA
jgi:hypothetical protein